MFKEFYQKYPVACISLGFFAMTIVIWYLFLSFVTLPLSYQQKYLKTQAQQIKLLLQLPSHWQAQIKPTDSTDLMDRLSKNWQSLMPNFKDIQFDLLNKTELRCRLQQIDEQAFMQWLWAMQKQYPFKINQMRVVPANTKGQINVEYVLQIL